MSGHVMWRGGNCLCFLTILTTLKYGDITNFDITPSPMITLTSKKALKSHFEVIIILCIFAYYICPLYDQILRWKEKGLLS